MKIFPFRAEREGTERWLGRRSSQIMEFMWERDSPQTVRDIVEGLGVHPGVISTALCDLVNHGLLLRIAQRNPHRPQHYVYTAAYTEDEFINGQMDAITESLGI